MNSLAATPNTAGVEPRTPAAQPPQRLHLVLNAISAAPGGGLTALRGMLGGWRAIAAPLRVTVVVGRSVTAEALRKQNACDDIVEYCLDASYLKQFWAQRRGFQRLLTTLQPDVLLSNNLHVPRPGCPQVVYHQNLYPLVERSLYRVWRGYGLKNAVRAWAAQRALREAEANTFLSEFLQRQAERIDPSSAPRNRTIYYGVSAELISAAQQTAQANDSPQFIALQAPTPHKANDVLIETLAIVRRERPNVDWKLTIAGPGDWSHWRQFAADRGVLEHIDFAGFVEHTQLRELLATSRALLYPSAFESFGAPLIEAAACGCPVVAVDATAITDVSGGAALLARPHDARSYADQVLRLVDDRDLAQQCIERGKARAREFSWAKSAGEFMDVFRRVTTKGAARQA